MSETMGNEVSPQLERYMQRDGSMLGRIINTTIDWGRELVGKPGLWLQAGEQEAQKLNARREGLDHGEIAIAKSGLDAADQKIALMMTNGLAREYPGIDQETMDKMITKTIDYVQEVAKDRVVENQFNLFSHEMLQDSRPIDRAAGLQKLEDLGLAMQAAEDRMTDNLIEADDMRPWDLVDDRMDIVSRDRDALFVATEMGFVKNDFGVMLSERGTAFTSQELLDKVDQIRGVTTERDAANYYLDMGR